MLINVTDSFKNESEIIPSVLSRRAFTAFSMP
jgi:hypothetical protein